MTASERLQGIAWLGLRLAIPHDWEVVRHSLNGAQGSLKFVDRFSHRLTFSWADCASAPNLERLVEDYVNEGLTEGTRLCRSRVPAPWLGLAQAMGNTGPRVYRAVRFDRATSRLIELLLLADADRDAEAQFSQLLASVHIDTRAEDATHWRAFNVAVTTPAGFRLARTEIKPADTLLEFRREEPGRRQRDQSLVSVRRRGMCRTWYRGDLEALIKAEDPKLRLTRFESLWHGEQRTLFAEGCRPSRPLLRLLYRPALHRVLAWHDDAENAVYQVSTWSGDQALSPAMFQLEAARAGR